MLSLVASGHKPSPIFSEDGFFYVYYITVLVFILPNPKLF